MTDLSRLDVVRLRGLHGLVRLALRWATPLQAFRLVERVAPLAPFLRDLDEARAAGRALSNRGSCLSRSVALSSRIAGAEVVIGVDMWRSSAMRAHAWVEVDGARLEEFHASRRGSTDGSAFAYGEVVRLRSAIARNQ